MATTKKTVAKKKTSRKSLTDKILVVETRQMATQDLQLYHKNPRVGDVDAIAESLTEYGQYRPILVNIGNKTGREYEILGGNHTYLGARKLGWDNIYVSLVDVDEDTATKIVLADNRLADKGTYDDKVLAELFESLPDVTGTGYSEVDVEEVLAAAQEVAEQALSGVTETIAQQEAEEAEERRAKTFSGSELGSEPDPSGAEYDDSDLDAHGEPRGDDGSLTTASEEELSGVMDIKEDLPEGPEFYAPGYWQLPALRTDMLAKPDDIPWDVLKAWAGSATKDDDDPDRWWLYNWGIDSTSGMQQPRNQVIIGFYCWDEYFLNWFAYTKRYTIKVLNSKIKYAVSPNYSMWPDQSRFLNLYALYRSRWISRYLQEAGIKIIPDLNWPMGDNEFLEKYILKTLPKNIPLIAMQAQTWDEKEVADRHEEMVESYRLVLDHCKPKEILFYAGKPGYEWFKKNVKFDGVLHRIEPRMVALAEKAKQRERKKGI